MLYISIHVVFVYIIMLNLYCMFVLDVVELESQLKEVGNTARLKMIVTDGVFSMDGSITPLKSVC